MIAEDPTQSTAEVTIATATIDTGVEQRDQHLKSPDFLEADKYPEITFTLDRGSSTTGGGDWNAARRPDHPRSHQAGRRSRPSTTVWPATRGAAPRAFFSAETKIDREDWGLTWNVALETGGWLVGKEIKIAIEVESVLQAD